MVGYPLFWVQTLAAAVLLVATILACTARWPRRYGQAVWPVLAAALLLGLAGSATYLAGYFEFRVGLDSSLFYPVLAWTVLYLAGIGVVLVRGLRQHEGSPAARTWLRRRLSGCLAIALVLVVTTFIYLDLGVRTRL